MTSARVTARGFAVGGAAPSWGRFAGEADPLVAAARGLVGARNPRLSRLDRPTLSAIVAAYLVLERGEAPASLVVCAEDGSAAADRAFWATARGRGGADASPSLFVSTLPSAVAGELAMTFALRGPCVVFAGAGSPDAAPFGGDPSGPGPCLRVHLRGWEETPRERRLGPGEPDARRSREGNSGEFPSASNAAAGRQGTTNRRFVGCAASTPAPRGVSSQPLSGWDAGADGEALAVLEGAGEGARQRAAQVRRRPIPSRTMTPPSSPQSHDALRAELVALICDATRRDPVDPLTISDATPCIGPALLADSLDVLEVVVAIDRVYGVSLRDGQVGRAVFADMGSLTRFVAANRVR